MGYRTLGASPSDCSFSQVWDEFSQSCVCGQGFVPAPDGSCIPVAAAPAAQTTSTVNAVSFGGCAAGQQPDPLTGACVCLPGYVPSPVGNGCIAGASSLVGGAPSLPFPVLPTLTPTTPAAAPQPPLPAISPSRQPTPQERQATAANTTGMAVAGILAGGALLLFLLD